MESRMDKYKDKEFKPSRVEKNKDLYKMIYSAYDEYENYKVPLEEREIDISSIKKNIMTRSEYKSNYLKSMEEKKEKEKINFEEDDSSNEVYDIKKLLDKVKDENPSERKTTIREEKYLDKLHLKDNVKTNLEKMKEEYEDVELDSSEEEKLFNTANLSLEILSDLKSSENTSVSPPMKEDDTEDDIPFKKVKKEEVSKEEKISKEEKEPEEDSFYSDMYKFKKKDFEEDDDDEEDLEESNNGFLFKILIIISIIILMALIIIYLVGYFSK